MKSKLVKGILAVIVVCVICLIACEGPESAVNEQVKKDMQAIENEVAADAVKQYEIAKTGGDKMQIYVQAGMVATAYMQAKDQANYKKWKAIEKQAGKEAGMPEQ